VYQDIGTGQKGGAAENIAEIYIQCFGSIVGPTSTYVEPAHLPFTEELAEGHQLFCSYETV